MNSPVRISLFAVLLIALLASHASAQRPFERLQRGWDDIRPRGQLLRDIFGPNETDRTRQAQIEQQRRAAQQRQQQQQQQQTQARRNMQNTGQQPRRMGSALEEPRPPRYSNQRSQSQTQQQRPQPKETGHPSRLEIAVKESKTPAGLQVDQVSTRGAAWAAGIRRGDIIVAVGGIETANKDDLAGITQVLKDGDQIEFDVMRRGKKETVMVQFGEAPAETVIDPQSEGPAHGRLSDIVDPAAARPQRGTALRQASGLRSVLDNGVTSRNISGSNANWQVQPPASRTSPNRQPQTRGNQPQAMNAAEVKQLQRQLREQQEQIELLQRQISNAKEIPGVPNQSGGSDSLLDFPK